MDNPAAWVIGLGLGALIAVLLPLIGLAILVWLLIKNSTRWMGVMVTVLAASSVLIPAPWLPWDPVLSFFDKAFLLTVYFFIAALPWSLVVYLVQRVRKMVASGA